MGRGGDGDREGREKGRGMGDGTSSGTTYTEDASHGRRAGMGIMETYWGVT